jgi:hypothetical protein
VDANTVIAVCRGSPRALGPGLWPGPRRQARGAGRGSRVKGLRLRSKRRAEGAPLRLEGPARTMRGVPARWLGRLHGSWRAWREGDGLAVVLVGAAAGYGGDRRRPVTGGAVRGSRRAVGLASEGRGGSCRPATARPRVNPGRLRRVTLAAQSSLGCSRRPSLLAARAVRRRRAEGTPCAACVPRCELPAT